MKEEIKLDVDGTPLITMDLGETNIFFGKINGNDHYD
jgi:hypothetical protein